MKRKLYLCFMIMPVLYTIMMLNNRRFGSINNVLAIVIYALICLILGISIMKFYEMFCNKKYYTHIAIILLIFIDMGIKIIIYSILNRPIILFRDILEVSISKNINQNALLNYFNISYSFWIIIIIKILFAMLIIVTYKYFIKRSGGEFFSYINLAFILFFSASFCSLLDSICYGYTLDYILFVDFMCCDIKDFYVDVGVGLFLIYYYKQNLCAVNTSKEIRENENNL